MAEPYQPKRRPIDPSVLNQTPAPQEVKEEPVIMRPQQDPTPPNMPMREGGLQIQGNVPPAFREALAAAKKPAATLPQMHQAVPESMPTQPPMTRQRPAEQPSDGILTRGGAKLNELINGIAAHSVPYEEITLPSKGRFYDGTDGPTDGKLHIRPMTGEEEQILSTPRFVKKGQAINMIFNRCMQEKFNSETFITPDRTYLLIYLRGISYTPEYDVEVKCPHCDRKFATTIDLNALYVDYCEDSFSVSNLTDKLPATGYRFTYRLSSGADERMIQEYRDRKLRFDASGQADDTLIYRTSLMIDDIEGISDKGEILALLKKLPIRDVAYLRNTVNEPPFGVETTVEIPCPGCLADFEIELPLEANFFFPRRRREKTQA